MIIFVSSISILIYFFAIIFYFGGSRSTNRPIVSLYLIFVTGSVVINLIFTASFLTTENALAPFLIYGGYVALTSTALILSFKANGVNLQEKLIYKKKLANSFFIIAFIPFSIVAFRFLFLGLSSGYEFGSFGWRAAISSSARGYEYLLYNSGSIILASKLASEKKFSIISIILVAITALLLTVYGGRFLLVAALVVGFFVRFFIFSNKPGRKLFITSFVMLVLIVFAAFFRYVNGESIEYSYELLNATIVRQFSGNVYDFALSYNYVNSDYASILIYEKIKTALLPFISKYTESTTIGAYLAFSAERSFEVGHRISAIGEAFYLIGFFGVALLAIIFGIFANLADSWINRSEDFFLLGITLAFSIVFSFFVDLSFLFTSVYLGAYLIFLNNLNRLIFREK